LAAGAAFTDGEQRLKTDIFQELYDSEINFSVSCFWDGGFTVKLGDDMNGWKAETNVDDWRAVNTWLRAEAVKAYPGSAFEKKWRGLD
jgi:hypothetical protein